MSYRNRVVAYTVAVVLAVAAAFFSVHRAMTGRLFRTGVDEPWHALVQALSSDPFVQARMLTGSGAVGGGVPATQLDAARLERDLEPDPRILGYVVVDPARFGAASGVRDEIPPVAVIDRFARAGADAARPSGELDRAIQHARRSAAAVPDDVETIRRGDITVRVGPVPLVRPVPPAALADAARLAPAVRRTLDLLSAKVLARLAPSESVADPLASARDQEALDALLSLNGALTSLSSRVLGPASLTASSGNGDEGALPEPLASIEHLVDELAEIPGPLAERVDVSEVRGWIDRIGAWIDQTHFQSGPTALVAAAFASPHLALFQQLARRYLWVSAFLLAGGVGLGIVVARRSTEPLGRIQNGIERFAHGDFAHRIEVGHTDVFASVARDLNAMAERIAEGERSRRLASMGLIVGGAAHELKNPVHALDQALGLITKYQDELGAWLRGEGVDPGEPRRRELAARIQRLLAGGAENVGRMSAILEEISAVQRLTTDRREPRDLAAACRGAVEALRARWDGQIDVRVEGPERMSIEAASSIDRIPQNLVSNAVAAVEEARAAGRPSHRVVVRLARDADGVCLAVDDDGAGVDPAVRDRIFDLFFTTREVGRGTGLGLFLVHEIVAAHGGHVRCVSPGTLGGATFEVRLPSGAALGPGVESV